MKKTIILISALTIVAVGIFCYNNKISSNYLKDIQTKASFEKYDYLNLKENASVIALVKIEDDLGQENSIINYNENDPFINSYYGVRKATVQKFYKNDKKLVDFISFLEPAAITSNNEYIHPEGYNKMEKGKTYIVFLSDETASGDMSIISANNGKIDVSSIEDNEFYDIAIKSVIDFETSNDELNLNDKEKILNAEMPTSMVDFDNTSELTIKNNLGGLSVNYHFDENSNKEFIDINGKPLIVDGKLFTE